MRKLKKGIIKPKLQKVRVLTVKGKPWGLVIANFSDKPRMYETSYWVRLNDGLLLKDMQKSELEFDYERIQSKCTHQWKIEGEFTVCNKCSLYILE